MILGIANALGQRTTNLYRVLQASGAALTCRPSPLSNGGRPPPPGGRIWSEPSILEERLLSGTTMALLDDAPGR